MSLSFVYQPGVGLYDKNKIDLDQDLRPTSITADVDERVQVIIRKFFLSSVTYPEIWRCASPAITSTFPAGDAGSPNSGICDTVDLNCLEVKIVRCFCFNSSY
jgi:hypothetical protein